LFCNVESKYYSDGYLLKENLKPGRSFMWQSVMVG
jgi:hypothetical protein